MCHIDLFISAGNGFNACQCPTGIPCFFGGICVGAFSPVLYLLYSSLLPRCAPSGAAGASRVFFFVHEVTNGDEAIAWKASRPLSPFCATRLRCKLSIGN